MTPPPPTTPDITIPVSRWTDDAVGDRTRRTRRRLLLAAAAQFDTHGYRGAALSDILEAAGLTKGALYFHFRSKLALAEALLDEVERSCSALFAEIGGRGLDPLWQLLVETDAYVGRWMYDPLVRGISSALQEPELREMQTNWLAAWESNTVTLLREAHAAGLLIAHVDPLRAGRAVVAMASGHFGLAQGPDDLWVRMSESWEGLLPIVTTPDWCGRWEGSDWRTRPRPVAEDYRRAREP
ncbi:TetR family transcriptional regulator [Actinomycetospora atypica]|uniref:TetR family transcriptional regulator n=1 Tax=Actinomycetospora atypica TaxID=1290095 RepID=A0ABV9YLJ5_9PSEU